MFPAFATYNTDSSGNINGLNGPNGTTITKFRNSILSPGNVMTKMPFSKMVTSGFSQTTGTQAFTSHLEIALESTFDAVRFIIPNNTNSLAGVIGKYAVGAAAGLDPTGATANADGLTQNNAGTWNNITWGGASSVTLTAGTGVNQPSYTVSDWIYTNSLTRTDSATQSSLPIIYCRFEIPSADGIVNIPQWAYGNDLYGQNGFSGNWGMDVTSGGGVVTSHRILRNIYQNTNGVTTPANLTQSTLQCGIPVIIQYATRRRGLNVMTIGDSITEGSSPAQASVSTIRAWGWAAEAVYALSTPDRPIELANFGWGAETSAQYTQRFIDLMTVNDASGLPVFKPDLLIYSPWSPNDGTVTQAVINAQFSQTARVLGICQSKGIIPILWTPAPVNALSAGQDTLRQSLITQLRQMNTNSSFILVDNNTVWGNGASPEQWAANMGCSDGMHPTDTGKAAAMVLLSPIIKNFLNSV